MASSVVMASTLPSLRASKHWLYSFPVMDVSTFGAAARRLVSEVDPVTD